MTNITPAADFAERVGTTQRGVKSSLKAGYDFVFCGSGTSGRALAWRLAESVLLVEAGGDDDVPAGTDPRQFFSNLGAERDWQLHAQGSSAFVERSA